MAASPSASPLLMQNCRSLATLSFFVQLKNAHDAFFYFLRRPAKGHGLRAWKSRIDDQRQTEKFTDMSVSLLWCMAFILTDCYRVHGIVVRQP